jgi:superfamily II DNA or RNA helicase
MKKQLYTHQKEAVKAALIALKEGETPYLEISTGGGKSLILADLMNRAMKQGLRVLSLVPSKELCEQNALEASEYIDSPKDIGLCCSKLNRFQVHRQSVIATYTSFLRRRTTSGKFDVLLIDECVTGDTEILTEIGFKRFDSLNKSLKVAQYDNGEISFVNPLRHIEKPYKGEMVKIKSDNLIDLDVTAGHDMLLKWHVDPENIHDRKIKAKDINFNVYKSIYVAGSALGYYEELTLKQKLMIITQADGNIFIQDDRDIPRISFSFTKERKINAFLSLMEEGNFRFTETKTRPQQGNRKESRIFHVFDIDYADKDISKFFDISKINNKKAKEIIEYMVNWDGSINKKTGQYYFSNTDEKSVNFYQSVSVLAGYKTNKTIQIDGRSENFNDINRLFISKHTNTISCQAIKKSSYNFDGTVYCVTVPSGNIVVRRNGKVAIIGNCHGVGYEPTSSYRKIITSLKRINPALKIIGVTATPVRMSSGRLEEKYLDFEPIFTKCAYQSSIPDLIKQGVLSNITSISGDIQVDLSGVPIKGGDYDTEISAVRFDAILPHAIPDLKLKIKAYGIETILIFASNVANARKIIEEWDGDNIRLIYGDMSQHDRSATIKWLKHGEGLRVVVNVNVLLVGFNFQKLDAVCFLRATKSLALYRQAVGRVLRSHEDKKIGFVIDYAGNIDEHGSIDGEIPAKNRKRAGEIPRKSCIAIVEETTEFEGLIYRKGDVCGYSNILSAKKCRVCHAEFITDTETGKYVMRTRGEILKAKIDAETYTYEVARVTFEKAYSKKDQTEMIKLSFIDESGLIMHNHYMCLSHTGYARHKSVGHLVKMMHNPEDFPLIASAHGGVNTENVLLLFQNAYDKYFKRFDSITLALNGKYKELKGWQFV